MLQTKDVHSKSRGGFKQKWLHVCTASFHQHSILFKLGSLTTTYVKRNDNNDGNSQGGKTNLFSKHVGPRWEANIIKLPNVSASLPQLKVGELKRTWEGWWLLVRFCFGVLTKGANLIPWKFGLYLYILYVYILYLETRWGSTFWKIWPIKCRKRSTPQKNKSDGF